MLFGLIVVTVGAIGWSFVGAAVGMRIGVRWRDPGQAAMFAALLTLSIALSGILLAAMGLRRMSMQPTIQLFIAGLFFMITPYITTVEVVDRTHPWSIT
jgi:hypothetical protein